MKKTKHAMFLDSVTGSRGQTKRIRTLAQARAVIQEGWAERLYGKWAIAEVDQHRPATPDESQLLNLVQPGPQ